MRPRRAALLLASCLLSAPALAQQAAGAAAGDAATGLDREAEADGVRIAQARFCRLEAADADAFVQVLQQRARERSAAAGLRFDEAAYAAATQAGYSRFLGVADYVAADPDGRAFRRQCDEVRRAVRDALGKPSRPAR